MTTIWTPRGAAERFDRAVDSSTDPSSDRAHADLVTLVTAIRSLPEVAPRPEHVSDLRARLMAEADRLAAARAVVAPVAPAATDDEDRLRLRTRPARSHRGRRTTVVIGALAALGVSTTVGVAAQTALPGEPLYGVKRALETARTQVALTETARGEVLLAHASDRLAETTAVLDSGDTAGTGALPATLDSFSDEATQASALLLAEYARTGDRALVDDLRTFTAASRAALIDMQDVMPADGVAAWTRAVEVVRVIDTDALAACPLCSADLGLSALDLPATPDFDAPRTAADPDDQPATPPASSDGPGRGGADGRGERPGRSGSGSTDEGSPDTVPDVVPSPGGDAPTASPAPRSPGASTGVDLDNPLGDLGGRIGDGLLGGGSDGSSSGKGSGKSSGGGSGSSGGLDLGGLDDLLP